jgi:hypothetical protein
MYPDAAQQREGFEMLIEAFQENPSRAPMQDILNIGMQVGTLRPRMIEVCRDYAEEFEANRAKYAHQNGYNLRLAAATMALAQLGDIAQRQGNIEEARSYLERAAQYDQEARRVANTKRW